MREIPEELVARIESGAATLCHVWLLERADGSVMGFTDHDRALMVDGVVCSASSGWTVGAAEAAAGLGAGSMSIAGGLDADALTAVDLDTGLYDGARVDLWRVDWDRPELRVRLYTARLARIRRQGRGFIAELEGPLAALNKVIGRTYGRRCDAVLGDARCGIDLDDYPGATCDRRWTTCVDKFNNSLNFRGFPDIPGDDFLAATPVMGGRNDGRSRR